MLGLKLVMKKLKRPIFEGNFKRNKNEKRVVLRGNRHFGP